MILQECIVYVLVGTQELRDRVCAAASLSGLAPVVLDSAGQYLRQPDTGVPSCLILGINLPDMSGLELQRRIAHTGVAIVFVADCPDLPAAVLSIKGGAVDFLTTPVHAAEFSRAVHNAIELDRYRRVERAKLLELRRRYRELTPREAEVFPLITAGMPNKQTASAMGICEITVQVHRGRIMRKMAARSFADLVRIADALSISCEFTGHGEHPRPLVQRVPTGQHTHSRPLAIVERNRHMFAGRAGEAAAR